MVYSNIEKSINYKESKNIDRTDLDYESTIYYGELFRKKINFIIGKPNYKYITNNIIYFNIYLVNIDKLLSKIGIYEINSDKYSYILDDAGDINMSLLNAPLIFKFSETFLINDYVFKEIRDDEKSEHRQEESDAEKSDAEKSEAEESEAEESEAEESEAEESEAEEEDESAKFISDSPKKSVNLSPLNEQTKEEALEEKRIFKDEENTAWIEKFLYNNNYGIVDNEGGGDCLFAVIRDGLLKINKKLSVNELRHRLSSEATEEIFLNYKVLYDQFMESYRILTNELKELVNKNKELKTQVKTMTIRAEQQQIIIIAKKIAERYKQVKQEIDLTKELLREYQHMKNVKTLSDFKKLINSCEFWADTWAISTLERILNIKLIILSSQQYNAGRGDLNNVLQCGQLNDKVLEERGVFNPTDYILVDYTGEHYKLITYKRRGALKFKEMPYDIKELVVNKCMEKQAGPFYIIPEFREFSNLLKIDDKVFDDTDVNIKNELYDNDLVFQFYNRSDGKPLPGKGAGEKISVERIKEFSELAQHKEWRKKLSNFWDKHPFTIDGYNWQSVEHYYQGNKFKKQNPDFYKLFTVESKSELSTDPALANAAGGKTGKLGSKVLRHKTIIVDKDFIDDSDKLMEKAMYAKFTQHKELKELLTATKNAKLVQYVRASPPIVVDNLMRVRKMLQN